MRAAPINTSAYAMGCPAWARRFPRVTTPTPRSFCRLSWPSEGNVEKGLDNQVVLYTPSVVNSPGQIGRDLGRCRINFNACLLSRLEKEEKPKLEELEEYKNYTRGAGRRARRGVSPPPAGIFRGIQAVPGSPREIREGPCSW